MTRFDFTLDELLKTHFKIGSIVFFTDNSYVVNELGKSAYPTLDGGLGLFKIIDANKPFPTDNKHSHDTCLPINNIKVRDIVTGKIYYCSNINILSILSHMSVDVESKKENTVIYKGDRKRVSEVFSNPYPFL